MLVYLDSDESKVAQIDNIAKIDSLEELAQICKRKLHLNDINLAEYGFKTKDSGILISNFGDIVESKRTMVAQE